MNDETELATGAEDVTPESEKFRSGEEHPEASAKTIRPVRAGGHGHGKKVRSQVRPRVPCAESGTLCLSVESESEPRASGEPRKKIPRERTPLVPKVQRYRRPLVVSGGLRLPAEIPPWELELVEGALSDLADTINEHDADPPPREDDYAKS